VRLLAKITTLGYGHTHHLQVMQQQHHFRWKIQLQFGSAILILLANARLLAKIEQFRGAPATQRERSDTICDALQEHHRVGLLHGFTARRLINQGHSSS